jgi:chromosome segregation ATPase
VAAAEEVYASLKKLLEEINETENKLLGEERSYESQIRRQKEVYDDLMKNYNTTISKFESKRTKFEFVNDHYQHTFRSGREELDKSLKQAQHTTQRMRTVFSEINKRLHSNIDTMLADHASLCSYESLKALAVFDMRASFRVG